MQKSKGKNKDTKATSATVADKARKNIEAKQRTALEMNKDLQGLQTVEEELALLEEIRNTVKEDNIVLGLTDAEARKAFDQQQHIESLLEGGVDETVKRFYDNATAMNKNGKTTTGIMKLASGYNNATYTSDNEDLRDAILKHADTQLETLTGPALTTFKAEIKGTQKLFNKKNVQDLLLGKERTQRVYFGTLQQKDIESGKIPQEQVTAENLEIGKHCITLVEATPAQEADVKSRLEHNEEITADQRPALDADVDSIGAYVYDLEQTITHLQAELKTFKK